VCVFSHTPPLVKKREELFVKF